MAEKFKEVISRNVWKDNQVLRQILGICSSLAVTNLMKNSLVMGLGLTFVTAFSSLTISLLRNLIPHKVRMIVQTLIIAAYVILVDIFPQGQFTGYQQSLRSICRPYHHKLHHNGPCGGLRPEKPAASFYGGRLFRRYRIYYRAADHSAFQRAARFRYDLRVRC